MVSGMDAACSIGHKSRHACLFFSILPVALVPGTQPRPQAFPRDPRFFRLLCYSAAALPFWLLGSVPISRWCGATFPLKHRIPASTSVESFLFQVLAFDTHSPLSLSVSNATGTSSRRSTQPLSFPLVCPLAPSTLPNRTL